MPKKMSKRMIFVGFFVLILASISLYISHNIVLAATGINKQINFQGKVTNTDGTNVSNSSYNFLFCIYTTSTPAVPCTAGANNDAIWRESKSLSVDDGIFQTNLGDTTTLPGSVDFNTDNIYLGINFNSNGQMTPLIQFTAVPYAFNSSTLQGSTWGAPGAIGTTTPNSASFTTLNSNSTTQLASNAGATWSVGNTTGQATVNSGGVSSWTNTSGNLTIATASSGILALTSAGALNLTSGANSTWTLNNSNNALNVDSNTFVIDAQNNRVGIGASAPGSQLTLSGGLAVGTTSPSSLYLSKLAPDGGAIFEGNVGIGTTNSSQKLSIAGTLGIIETGGTPQYYTIFQGGDQNGNITYTLPTTTPVANGYALVANTDGTMSWAQVSGSLGIGTTISSASVGSVLFSGAAGTLQQDNPYLYYNYTNHLLGIGTTAAFTSRLTVSGGLSIGTTAVGSVYLTKQAPDGGAIFEGNIGIGTTNPGYGLDVYSSARFQGGLLTYGNPSAITLADASGGTMGYIQIANSGVGIQSDFNSGGKAFLLGNDGGGNYRGIIVNSNGNVGIGNTNPTLGILQITSGSDSIYFNPNTIGANGSNMRLTVNGDATRSLYLTQPADNNFNVGFGDSTPDARLELYGGAGTFAKMMVSSDTSTDGDLFYIGYTGLVGIGTTNPSYGLHVAGSLGVGGTAAFTGLLNDTGEITAVMLNGFNQLVYRDLGTNAFNSIAFMTNPMTTAGDIIFGSAGGTATRLAGATTDGWVLKYSGTNSAPYWAAAGSGMPVGTNGQTLYNSSGSWTSTYNLFNDGTFVGIGTTIPASKLTISGGLSVGTTSPSSLYISKQAPDGGAIFEGAVVIGGTAPIPNSLLSLTGNSNSWIQYNIKNISNGGSASSDYVATADTGTDTTNYIDMGINSSGYNDAGYTISGALSGYLYTNGGDLTIGTQTAGKVLKFHTAGTLIANERMRIDETGRVGIGTTAPGALFDVFGTGVSTTVSQILGLNLTTGVGLNITMGAGVTTGSAIKVAAAGASQIDNGLLNITHGGAYTGVGGLMNLVANSTSAGNIANISGGSLTTGVGLYVTMGTGVTSGNALKITAGGTSAIANGLLQITHGGAFTGAGGLMNLTANATTGGTISSIYGTGLTSGVGLYVSMGTGVTSGAALKIDAGGTSAIANGLVQITNAGAYTGAGGLLNISSGTASGVGMAMALNSLTSGTGLMINSSATALTGNLFGINLSGDNAGNTGNLIKTVISGTNSAANGMMITNLGTGYGLRVNDETGDNDTTPFVINATGNVGIGTSSPTQGLLTVNGNIATLAQGDLLFYDSDNSHYTGFQALATTTANLVYTLPGSGPVANGYALVSATDGTLSWAAAGGSLGIGTTITSATSGSIFFAGVSGTLNQDNDNFFWDNTNNRLGIGTTAPTQALSVSGNMKINGIGNGFIFADGTTMTTAATAATGMTSIADLNFAADSDANGSGEMFFAVNGTERMRITNSGQVNIGFTTDQAAQLAVNTTGTNDLLSLQQLGIVRMEVANSGGITINSSTANIVKTSTGNASDLTDFNYSGSSVYNTTAVQGLVTINDSGATAAFISSGVITAGTAGAGSHSIRREDGSIIIIHGGGVTNGSRWDGSSGSMTLVTVSTANVGAGAISLKRPDGRYLLVNGGTATSSAIYDPWGTLAAIAGPTLTSCTANMGTNAFQKADGTYAILCGGSNNNGVYLPTSGATGTYTTAPVAPSTFSTGTQALQRDDNTFMVMFGGNSGSHAIYNANMTFTTTNPWSALNVGTGATYPVTTGAVSVRRNDGKYLIIPGAANQSMIYDPRATQLAPYGTFTTSPNGPTNALGDGAQLIWRPDGKYILIQGGGSTNTYIVDPSGPTFVAGPALNNSAGSGSHAVLRPNGKYQMIRAAGSGTASTTTEEVNVGLIMGGDTGLGDTGPQAAYWQSECISVGGSAPFSTLNDTSTINWNTNAEGYFKVKVKTGNGSCSGSYKDIPNSGDKIVPTPGDNRIQIKVYLRRDMPTLADQEWGLWRGLNQTRYRRKVIDPGLYDITINNSALYRRSQFDLGFGTSNVQDASGPLVSNVNVAANGSLQLASGVGNQALGSTTNPVGGAYAGAYGSHTPLNTRGGEGTIVMKRPDGRFMVAVGETVAPSAASAEVYDPNTQTFTNNANGVFGSTCSGISCAPNDGASAISIGRGSLAFKRPDGKFFIVAGNGGTAGNPSGTNPQYVTNIYDPVASTFATGPSLLLGVGVTAPGVGSQAIPLPNGNVMIIYGANTRITAIYNPVENIMTRGPDIPGIVVGMGSIIIPRPDGTWLIHPGSSSYVCAAQSNPYIFDPYLMTFYNSGLAWTALGPGANAVQRSDGTWLVTRGAGTATTCAANTATFIYNPFSDRTLAGPTATAVSYGANAMQRPNGTWLIMNGNNTVANQYYVENDGAMGAGTKLGSFAVATNVTAGSAPGTGSIAFQRDDGKFVVIPGMVGATGTAPGGTGTGPGPGTTTSYVMQYDAGWVMNGMYRSEQICFPSAIDTKATLSWKTSGPSMAGISAEVRTAASRDGLQTASGREVENGGLVNPGATDTCLQVNFNFKRTVPNKNNATSIWNDVWNGQSSAIIPYRTFLNPTLSEFKITKDGDLLDLQADGNSLFRVSTNGDIYTSANGSVRTGGADLAENYSSTEALEKGEVVSIDPINDHSVKKSLYQNQPDVLGVVSTDPGFVAGSYTEDSYPIALVGRVPVKVSTENGKIRAGDYLTAASVPGFAMRATKSGRVIGKALEDLKPENITACPAEGYPMEGRQCGMVMMFVNLTDYSGMSVEKLMEEVSVSDGISAVVPGDNATEGIDIEIPVDDNASVFSEYQKQANILDFLKTLQSKDAKNPNASEILTGRLSADKEVITPTLFADLVVAKKIRADQIEGLEFWLPVNSDQLGMTDNTAPASVNLEDEINGLKNTIAGLSAEKASSNPIFDLNKLKVQDGLIIGGPVEFQGPAVFRKIAEFIDKTIFRNNVEFEKEVAFNQDTAGYAVIGKGEKTVKVEFENEYDNVPIVNATLSVQNIEDAEMREATEDLILATDVKFVITNVTTKGFEIKIEYPNDWEIPFAWQAVSVKEAKTFQSSSQQPSVDQPLDNQSDSQQSSDDQPSIDQSAISQPADEQPIDNEPSGIENDTAPPVDNNIESIQTDSDNPANESGSP